MKFKIITNFIGKYATLIENYKKCKFLNVNENCEFNNINNILDPVNKFMSYGQTFNKFLKHKL